MDDSFYDYYATKIFSRHAATMALLNDNAPHYIALKQTTHKCPVEEDDIFLWDVSFTADGRVSQYTFPTTYPRSAEVDVNSSGRIVTIDFRFNEGPMYNESEAVRHYDCQEEDTDAAQGA